MAQKIRIIAKREGFRRCGVAHSETPTLHDVGAFTSDQLEALKGDGMLVVDVVEVDDDGNVQVMGVPVAEGKAARRPTQK